MNKLFLDINGKLSTKRVAGFAALGISVILTIVSLFFDVMGNAPSLLVPWLGFATASLISTVAERKGK